MAAAKCIMSIRRWAFLNLGDDQAIQFIAMVRFASPLLLPLRRRARFASQRALGLFAAMLTRTPAGDS